MPTLASCRPARSRTRSRDWPREGELLPCGQGRCTSAPRRPCWGRACRGDRGAGELVLSAGSPGRSPGGQRAGVDHPEPGQAASTRPRQRPDRGSFPARRSAPARRTPATSSVPRTVRCLSSCAIVRAPPISNLARPSSRLVRACADRERFSLSRASALSEPPRVRAMLGALGDLADADTGGLRAASTRCPALTSAPLAGCPTLALGRPDETPRTSRLRGLGGRDAPDASSTSSSSRRTTRSPRSCGPLPPRYAIGRSSKAAPASPRAGGCRAGALEPLRTIINPPPFVALPTRPPSWWPKAPSAEEISQPSCGAPRFLAQRRRNRV